MRAQTERKRILPAALSLALAAGVSLAAAGVAAAGNVYSCGTISGSNAVLQSHVTFTGSAECFKVTGGYNLSLNGYTVTCQNGYNCGPAVECDTTGGTHLTSVIQGKTNDTVTDISGNFSAGVKNCGTVKNLKIVGAGTGVLFDDAGSDGKAIFSNVIEPKAGGTGIAAKMKDNTDSINDNRITGGAIGIQLLEGKSAADGAWVRQNILRKQTTAGIQCTLTSDDYFRIHQNLVTEGGDGSVPFDIATNHASSDDNICEDAGARCECSMDEFTVATVGSCPL